MTQFIIIASGVALVILLVVIACAIRCSKRTKEVRKMPMEE